MELIVKNVTDLTSEEYRKLYRLNEGKRGLMQSHLQSAYSKQSNIFRKEEKVIMLVQGTLVLGWALLLTQKLCGRCKFKNIIHVYVRVAERKKNHGNTLVAKALELTQGEKVYCRGNAKFFKRYNIKPG